MDIVHSKLLNFQGSRDNMSIIIIAFPGAPKVDPEAVRKEEELNSLIKQKVTGSHFLFTWSHMLNGSIFIADIIEESGTDISFSSVFQKMIEEGIEGLPPAGGIHSK